MTNYLLRFLRSRLGHVEYWVLAAWLLCLGVYNVWQRGFAGGPTLTLAFVVVAFGLRLLWQERNVYLRALVGADKHLFRAILFERRGMIDRSLGEYARHEARFPGNLQAIERRVLLLIRLNRTPEAVAEAGRMLVPYADAKHLTLRAWLFYRAGSSRLPSRRPPTSSHWLPTAGRG